MIIRIGFFVKAIATWRFVNRNKKSPSIGSVNRLTGIQTMELGMGLEFSTRLFQQFSIG